MHFASGNCLPLDHIKILHASFSGRQHSIDVINIATTRRGLADMEVPNDSSLGFDEQHVYCSDPGKISDAVDVVIAYIAGFVVRHSQASLKCPDCSTEHTHCVNKAHSFIRSKWHGGLIFPSNDVLMTCQNTERELRRALAYSTLAPCMHAAKISAATMATFIAKTPSGS